jgi:hypothetical protein
MYYEVDGRWHTLQSDPVQAHPTCMAAASRARRAVIGGAAGAAASRASRASRAAGVVCRPPTRVDQCALPRLHLGFLAAVSALSVPCCNKMTRLLDRARIASWSPSGGGGEAAGIFEYHGIRISEGQFEYATSVKYVNMERYQSCARKALFKTQPTV